MIREYINELVLENKEKLKKLEQQLKELMLDLDCSQKWLENLQSETDLDTNIFSPRVMDPDLKNKTENVKDNINKTNQDIEYVKAFIETHLAKKQEYERMLAELDEISENISGNQDREESIKEKNEMSTQKKAEQMVGFLADLYKKTDLCLSLLYDDRTKCKNELKAMKSAIRNMAESMDAN